MPTDTQVFGDFNAAPCPMTLSVETRWYVLEEHDVHAAAWVFKP